MIQAVWNYGGDNLKDNNLWINLPAAKENRVIKQIGICSFIRIYILWINNLII
ncbi:hypothetical protein JTS97_04660 [Clostridium botulinum]|nr:hypothetical protein [Clostridium botulinum]